MGGGGAENEISHLLGNSNPNYVAGFLTRIRYNNVGRISCKVENISHTMTLLTPYGKDTAVPQTGRSSVCSAMQRMERMPRRVSAHRETEQRIETSKKKKKFTQVFCEQMGTTRSLPHFTFPRSPVF